MSEEAKTKKKKQKKNKKLLFDVFGNGTFRKVISKKEFSERVSNTILINFHFLRKQEQKMGSKNDSKCFKTLAHLSTTLSCS